MGAVETLSQFTPMSVIQILSSTLVLIAGAYLGVKKIYAGLEDYRQRRNGIENKQATVNDRLTKLEEEDVAQLERLNTIDATLQQIVATLDLMNEENKRDTIITNRSLLHRLAIEFRSKGYLTMAESEMFEEVAKRYIECGGNSLFKSHIIPEIQALPVHE